MAGQGSNTRLETHVCGSQAISLDGTTAKTESGRNARDVEAFDHVELYFSNYRYSR